MSTPKQFLYCRFVNGTPLPGLIAADQAQKLAPQLNTTIDSLTAEELLPLGLIRVVRNAYPMDGYRYAESLPELQEGVWVAPWAQQPTPDRDQRMAERSRTIRNDRNIALSQCDWTQIPDAQLSAEQKAAWGAYRQALRDLTAQPTFPWEVMWPAKP